MKLKNKTKNWKEFSQTYPKVNSTCLVYGIDEGSYGYSDDKEVIYRCRIFPMLSGKPNIEILESLHRYFHNFIPIKYKEY